MDVVAQRIVTWNVASTEALELVDAPLRVAPWQRDREALARDDAGPRLSGPGPILTEGAVSVSGGQGTVQDWTTWCPRQESNLRPFA